MCTRLYRNSVALARQSPNGRVYIAVFIKVKILFSQNLTCLFFFFFFLFIAISKNPSAANGYIEGTELDGFLAEFVSSVNIMDVGPEVSLSKLLLLS